MCIGIGSPRVSIMLDVEYYVPRLPGTFLQPLGKSI